MVFIISHCMPWLEVSLTTFRGKHYIYLDTRLSVVVNAGDIVTLESLVSAHKLIHTLLFVCKLRGRQCG